MEAAAPSRRYKIVVIGVSQGGLNALDKIFSTLPVDFPLAVAVVQHRSAESKPGLLTALLRRRTQLPVLEPHDKEMLGPGAIYIAPPDYHLIVDSGAFALSTDGPVTYARPSIDVLFTSAAEQYRSAVIGVVLTGASRDGAAGARQIKMRGGYLIVQDPKTAECGVMPTEAIAAALPDLVLPLEQIGPALIEAANAAKITSTSK